MKRSDFIMREKRLWYTWKDIIPIFNPYGDRIMEGNAHFSMYCITEEASKIIARSGSIKGFAPEHYSKYLWIDVDCVQSGKEFFKLLRDKGFKFKAYFSGHKGYHFAIMRRGEPSSILCYQDKAFVQDLMREFPYVSDVDTSIYQPLHLLRAVGCQHDITRKFKKLIRTVNGDVIPSVERYEISSWQKNCDLPDRNIEANRFEKTRQVLMRWTGALTQGSRYMTLWCISKDLFKLDYQPSTVHDILLSYNEQFDKPTSDEEIWRALNDAKKAVEG